MKLKNKKTIVAVTAVLLVVVVGATFAYFQSSASFENLFTAGTYKVVTREVFESPDNWAPGEEIPKTITSTNEGTIPAAVRVSYTEQWLDENDNDITSQVANGTVIINLDNTSDWTNEGNYYYYNYILEPQDTTTSFIKSVTLNPNLNGITCTPSNDGSTQTCTSNNPILGGTYKLIITKETVQADKYASVWNTNVEITEKPTAITYLTRQVEGQITPGDVIGIGETEDFYVISTNSEETVLLAKYNLLVGYLTQYQSTTEPIDPNVAGYGLQSVEAMGGYSGENYGSGVGTVMFSTNDYWMDGYEVSNQYASNVTSHYGSIYPYVYDENSEIYPYISGENGYVNKLKEMGAPASITGRLLSYEEAEEAYDLVDNGNYIVNNGIQDYWLGSVTEEYPFWACNQGLNSNASYESDGLSGVRPVIEIPTSELR